MCRVRTNNQFYRVGWRYIQRELIDRFAGQSHPWLWAKEPIPAGTELLIPYRNAGSTTKAVHQTLPPGC